MGKTSGSKRLDRVVELTVPEDYDVDTRVDVYLADQIEEVSRSKIQKGIKQGLVTVNGEAVQKSDAVAPGDQIWCGIPSPPPIEASAEPIPLDIVYEDEVLLVVNKPAGMVVHPAAGHRSGTLVNALLYHVGTDRVEYDQDEDELDEDVGLATRNAAPRSAGNPTIRPGIVHRLDKDTSGLLVIAKNDRAHWKLSKQFEERSIERTYHAMVWGVPDPVEGEITGAIGRNPHDRKRMAVVDSDRGKAARTHYKTVDSREHVALLEVKLETGRTHQIRVHLQHVDHPVVGDPTYGGRGVKYGPVSDQRFAAWEEILDKMPRQALHAASIGFVHPESEEFMDFSVDWPSDMRSLWDAVGGLAERQASNRSW